MNLYYFKSQIAEELRGARDYAKLALATRETDPAWSLNFASMSSAEMDHARKLFAMAEQYYKNLSDKERNGRDGVLYREIVNLITEDVTRIQWMHEMLPRTTSQNRSPVIQSQPMPVQPVG